MASCSASSASKDWAATYVRLAPGASPAQIERGMPGAIGRRMPFNTVIAGDQTLRWRWTQQMLLLPLANVHLHRESAAGRFDRSPDVRALGTLAAIGALIVLMAVINFVNVMTARGSRRGLEVGIRKVAGARRGDLIVQFVGESQGHRCRATRYPPVAVVGAGEARRLGQCHRLAGGVPDFESVARWHRVPHRARDWPFRGGRAGRPGDCARDGFAAGRKARTHAAGGRSAP